jgi:secreted PhoX family phosphatase
MSTSDLDCVPSREGVSRRTLLTRSASAGAGIVLAGSIPGLFGSVAVGKHGHEVGYGPLVPDPAGILSLPKGFSYKIVARSGTTLLETGEPTPDDPDGTAAFRAQDGGTVLVNNHEIAGGESFRVPALPGFTYDPLAGGGTTTIEVDKYGNRIREYVSLAGTHNNCAGGITPWDTWVTCEETERSPTGSALPHGYCFEVDPYDRDANRDPKPLRFLGRYAHESVVVDPETHTIYLTEDASNPNGLLYRWTPPAEALPLGRGTLRTLGDEAGTLDAMQAVTKRGELVPDLAVYSRPGTRLKVEWVPVPDRAATTLSTRRQFPQITRSRKLEGMWWGDEGAYFVASFARTGDGSAAQHDGQVWHYDPQAGRIALMLWFAYTPLDQDNDPDGPDNITVSPFGGVILAEDGDGAQHLVGATDDGETYFFARNDIPGESEFTGPTFSKNRRILFANVQSPGHVFAIQGPFRRQ